MISLGTDILKKKKSKILVSDFVVHDDPTHMVGYKKMNLQKKFGKTAGKENRAQNYAALSKLSPADDIRRKESPQRRLQYPSK